MKYCRRSVVALVIATATCFFDVVAFAAPGWQEDTFPPPNGGRLVFSITSDGNPACASYDAANCLWGQTMDQIDFSRVRPLVCGAAHRKLYGVTGFEDPNHWCNLALREHPAQTAPATPPPVPPAPRPPAGGYRMTDWSGWSHAAGVQYRYRVGWDPANSNAANTVDAIYEVRNPAARPWSGAARSVNCAQNTLAGSTDVSLAPGQTKEVRVRSPNCGNTRNPDIRPDVVRAGRID
jgi:hypothetical protein